MAEHAAFHLRFHSEDCDLLTLPKACLNLNGDLLRLFFIWMIKKYDYKVIYYFIIILSYDCVVGYYYFKYVVATHTCMCLLSIVECNVTVKDCKISFRMCCILINYNFEITRQNYS